MGAVLEHKIIMALAFVAFDGNAFDGSPGMIQTMNLVSVLHFASVFEFHIKSGLDDWLLYRLGRDDELRGVLRRVLELAQGDLHSSGLFV